MRSVVQLPTWARSQMTVAIAEHWDTPMILDEYCKDEIVFWKNNIHLRNFKNCFVFRKPQKVTFSDASNIACGAVSYINDGEYFATKCGRRTKGVELLRGEN